MSDTITPGAPATPLATVTLPDGRWLRLHVASINQQLLIDGNSKATKANARLWYDELRRSVVETSWGGDVGDGLGMHELLAVVNRWMVATEDVALPLASGSDSETTPSEPDSPKPTASRPHRSRSRRSSASSK